jgi:Prp8 binding protein
VSRFPVTAVAFADAGDAVYAGGLDNEVHVWDLRTQEVSMTLSGHTDTITGLAVSSDGAHVLSNSMDCSLRVWDVRPYAPAQRCTKVLKGHLHNFEKTLLRCAWSPDDKKVTAGSADRNVYIWDVESGNALYKLPGACAGRALRSCVLRRCGALQDTRAA